MLGYDYLRLPTQLRAVSRSRGRRDPSRTCRAMRPAEVALQRRDRRQAGDLRSDSSPCTSGSRGDVSIAPPLDAGARCGRDGSTARAPAADAGVEVHRIDALDEHLTGLELMPASGYLAAGRWRRTSARGRRRLSPDAAARRHAVARLRATRAPVDLGLPERASAGRPRRRRDGSGARAAAVAIGRSSRARWRRGRAAGPARGSRSRRNTGHPPRPRRLGFVERGQDRTRSSRSGPLAARTETTRGRRAPAPRSDRADPRSGLLTSCRPCRPCRACRRRRRCSSRGRRRRSPRW